MNSMTAFGRGVNETAARTITVEMKSVNSRFLDCTVRLPRSISYLEEDIKASIQAAGIRRGKIEISVNLDLHGAETCAVTPDLRLASSYIGALRTLRDEFGLTDDISVMRVAENRDLFLYEKPKEDGDVLKSELFSALDEAKEAFLARRAVEGENTKKDIAEKMQTVMAAAAEIGQLSEAHVRDCRQRFEERLRALMGENAPPPDEARLLTECALYADRMAIDEELARLSSHYEAFLGYLKSKEPVGRPLDFLLQEFNRETNTIGSKANHAVIARLVVKMKTELEKIREQVQNLE